MSEGVKLTIVSDPAEEQPVGFAKNLTVGEKLAAARANQELSIDQIAGQLKWSSRQIAEIEAGNYSVFPDMLTVRGFVRSYAKFLKIDPAPLLEQLLNEFDKLPPKPIDRPKLDTPFSTGRMPWLNQQHQSPQKIFAGLFLAVLCLLAAFVWRAEILHVVGKFIPGSSEKVVVQRESQTGLQTDTQPVTPIPQTEDKSLDSTKESDESVQETKATEQKTVPVVAPNVQHDNSDVSVSKGATAVTDASGAQPLQQHAEQAVAVSSADALILKFKQDSWVQIKRLNGSVVTSKLYKAGTEETIGIDGPVNMVIGNAPGVEATLRGQALVLPAQAGTNVVNLSIK